MRDAPRVFVVDDEPTIRETIAAILYKEGYEAIPFVDGPMALFAAAEESPDLLISDVLMPGMNGVDLAIYFKTLHPRCRVLLFSAAAATMDLLASARMRGYDFELLAKPLPPEKLLERIQALLSLRLVACRAPQPKDASASVEPTSCGDFSTSA